MFAYGVAAHLSKTERQRQQCASRRAARWNTGCLRVVCVCVCRARRESSCSVLCRVHIAVPASLHVHKGALRRRVPCVVCLCLCVVVNRFLVKRV